MRFLQPIGILHNNNDNPSKRHSTYATTNGNSHQIVTIIQPNSLSGQNETTTSYIDDDHPNHVTITNSSVTFTKNHFHQNNREKYKVASNDHYVNEIDHLIRESGKTTNAFNGNGLYPFLGSAKLHQRDNLNEHSQVINNENQTYNNINNHHHNAITNNRVCRRENLTKLDLDTHIEHPITRGGDCGSSICSESSPDDSFMDDEDVRSISPSICPSLDSPETEVKYPRGIINPNYPGFQHLAHTLAEHFVDHHFEQSDSEVSEFEVELKTASESDDGVNNNNPNTDDDLDKIEEILKGVFKSKHSSHLDENVKLENNFFSHNVTNVGYKMNNKCDVLTTNVVSSPNDDSKAGAKEERQIFPTPDILMKNNSFEEHIDFAVGNQQPDILKNVFSSECEIVSSELEVNDKCDDYDNVEKSKQSQWSITPIDIIGNFEQEVEREFGLIVSGYRSSSSDDEMCISVEKGIGAEAAMHDKMTDAVLSNAKETISTTIGECAHDQLKLNSEKRSFNDVADEHTNKITFDERQRSVIKSSHTIPTAIVKPKYQRTSYDDRQLPPVVSIDREKPWYDNYNGNGNVTLNKKIQQLPHFERKHKKHRIGSRTNSGSVSEKEKFNSILLCEKEIDSSSVAVVIPRKKDKMEQIDVYGHADKGIKCSTIQKNHPNLSNNNNSNNCSSNNNVVYRKGNSDGAAKDNNKESLASFDVYNIETALPVIDLEAIENHLKAAKEEERRKRNDREEIRRRLAMGSEYDYFGRSHSDRPTRKPSLHSRLQGGMNLQICFMNETASDNESPSSDSESCPKLSKSLNFSNNSNAGNTYSRYSSADSHPYNARPLSVNVRKSSSTERARPSSLPIGPKTDDDATKEIDFFTKQARLQIEARMALAQAKDMAHMQMELDRQKQKQSPITEIIRNSLEKVGITFPEEKRRVSRLMLTDMNVAQLQVIVNEFHTQIERLNENLVQFLMERDELHMSQDSMLVDIEDLTRYLLAKEQTTDKQNNQPAILLPTQEIIAKDSRVTTAGTTTNRLQTQSKLLRITNLVKK